MDTNDTNTSVPTKEGVARWLDQVRSQLERLRAALEPLLQQQAQLRSREKLLNDLLASYGPGESVQGERVSHAPASMAPNRRGSVREYVLQNAVDILRAAGAPLHINDLHREFQHRGLQIPGAGRPENLTAHLRRSVVINSPERGMYALAEGPVKPGSQKPPGRHRRRHRLR